MVFDHGLFTLGYMFGHPFSAKLFDFFTHISPAFAVAFILMCGISCTLSRNNTLRGAKMLGAAMVVTIVSIIIMPDAPIIFGILHLLGVCVMLYEPLKGILDKTPIIAGILVCTALFLLTYSVEMGNLGFGPFQKPLPKDLYTGDLMILGFRNPWHGYSDYFPLLPWMFPFFAGALIGKRIRDGKVPKCFYKPRIPFLSMLGQNAFFVYLAHQPLAYGVFYIIYLLSGSPEVLI